MGKNTSANEKKIAESLIIEYLPPKSYGLPVLSIFVDLAILARSLFPEQQPRSGQGSELAAGTQGSVQSDHAALRAEAGRADRQMKPVVKSSAAATLPHNRA
jgi:hypothetical protein